jgi:hypothetical protein
MNPQVNITPQDSADALALALAELRNLRTERAHIAKDLGVFGISHDGHSWCHKGIPVAYFRDAVESAKQALNDKIRAMVCEQVERAVAPLGITYDGQMWALPDNLPSRYDSAERAVRAVAEYFLAKRAKAEKERDAAKAALDQLEKAPDEAGEVIAMSRQMNLDLGLKAKHPQIGDRVQVKCVSVHELARVWVWGTVEGVHKISGTIFIDVAHDPPEPGGCLVALDNDVRWRLEELTKENSHE